MILRSAEEATAALVTSNTIELELFSIERYSILFD